MTEGSTTAEQARTWINAENVRNRNFNNDNLSGIGASDSTKTATFTITNASVDRTSSTPQVTISVANINTFVNGSTGDIPSPQEIRVVGNIIANRFGIVGSVQQFSLTGLLVAFVGAVIVLAVLNLVQRGRVR